MSIVSQRMSIGFVAFLAALLAGLAPQAPAADPPALSPKVAAALERVAGSYYEQATAYAAKRKEQDRRDSEALADEKLPVPLVAGGSVFNRRGRPVEAATINIIEEKTGRMLASGLTDKEGAFSIPLPTDRYRTLRLVVTKKDFANWEQGDIYGGIVNFPTRLDLDLHAAFQKKLGKDKDPAERFWQALELAGGRNTELDVAEIFPSIGQIRQELVAIAQSPLFRERDQDIFSPADRARQLLTWLQDPADADLFDQDLSGDSVPEGLIGADVEDVCKKWTAHQAQKLGWNPMPDFSCGEPVYDLKKKRAMTTLTVRFAHWGYSQRLMLMNENKKWGLRFVQDYKRWQDR